MERFRRSVAIDRGLTIALIVTIVAGLWFGGTTAIRVVRAIKEVNEPDPAKFDTAKLEKQARWAGVEARVERVLYVNQDVNAGIFIGRDVSLNGKLIDGERYRPGSGRWGEVRVHPLRDGGKFVAYYAATTPGESRQAQRWFGEVEAKMLREWMPSAERAKGRASVAP